MGKARCETPGIGHNRPPQVRNPIWPESTEAIIRPRGRSATTAGRARADEWLLRFERRTAPFIDPVMGWTGGEDPLACLELTFRTRDDAIRYAQREGLSFRIEGDAAEAHAAPPRTEKAAGRLYATAAALAWMDPRYGVTGVDRRPDLDRALVNPAAVFASPSEVLGDLSLSPDEKREVLRRWAWDTWLMEVAADEAMVGGEPSRLEEVKAALTKLELDLSSLLIVARRGGGRTRR